MRRAARKDSTHTAVVAFLRDVGASVVVLEPRPERPGTVDLLVGLQAVTILMEVKSPGERLSPEQEKWHREWRGAHPYVVHSQEDAHAALHHAIDAPASPPWVGCDCGNLWCLRHGLHAYNCPCPPLEDWGPKGDSRVTKEHPRRPPTKTRPRAAVLPGRHLRPRRA